MYKIYINEKPVFICSKEEFPNIKNNTYHTINEGDKLFFNNNLFELLENNSGLIFISEHPDHLYKHFSESLFIIEAAGGVIFNPDRTKILFIYRRGKWDLPKGKIDEGESIKKAAWREVEEECGIKTHQIEDHLLDTFHIYQLKSKWVLKKSYWFVMTAEEEKLTPQAEEGITKAEWIAIGDIMKLIEGETYPTILDLLEELDIT
jgi:ADP-ribose pyrophosphatase YjhB (NUDIX family)